MATGGIILEQFHDSGVAYITLDRPDKHNALDQKMIEEWLNALEGLRTTETIRVIVTRGNGPSFGSGLDLYYLREAARVQSLDFARSSLPRLLAETLREYPKVTIAQVHGYCLGHAMVNMCAHDLAYAAADAQIGMPEILRGSFGQMATASLFHSGIPAKRAAHIQLTGRYTSGAEAAKLGLVSDVVELNHLAQSVSDIATEIASRKPAALAAAKLAVQMGAKLNVGEAIKLDQLVGAWQKMSVDSLANIEDYLASQAGKSKLDRSGI